MQLYHDVPKSKGVENALKRARQMLNIEWTPIRSFPSGINSATPEGTVRLDTWMPAYRPQKGMAYSSVRKYEKYVGFNVSFETFMTALANPNSVLYTRSQHGVGKGMSSYYGIVCSCFASYVCGFPYRTSGARITIEDGVTEVDPTRLEDLELCDIVLNKTVHVAVITDIQRDVEGNVRIITVSESTKPVCVSRDYTPELFRKYWLENGYHIYRYEGVHKQTYQPTPYVHVEDDPWLELPPVNTAFMSNFGDKANSQLGEDVEFSVFEEGWETIEITAPDGTAAVLPIADAAAVYTPEKAGVHTAVCRKRDEMSRPVTFCVTDSTVTASAESVVSGGQMEITFRNAAPDTVFLYVINTSGDSERQRGYFTAEEIAAGKAAITVNVDPGDYYVYTVARNEYGFYASVHCPFRVD